MNREVFIRRKKALESHFVQALFYCGILRNMISVPDED